MIVLDASITVGWLFNEASSSPPIDDILATKSIIVPAHWTAEIGHAALKALRRKIVSPERIDAIGDDLGHIAITIEPPIAIDQMLPMLRFARLHGLTMYDAAYVHLALSRRAELATLDKAMRGAASKLGIALWPA